MEFLRVITFIWISMAQIRINLPSDEYAQTTNKRRGTLLKNVDENVLRMSGAKHANLWCKGELYPCNPLTGRHPNFNSVSSLVIFACEGKSGLLGYYESMVQYSVQLAFHLNNANLYMQEKKEVILKLEGEMKENKSTILHLQKRNLQLEQDKTLMECLIKQQEHENWISKSEAIKFKKQICLLEARLKRLKKTSLGLRERKKGKKPIHELKNFRCGGAKRRIYAVHQVLHTNKEKGAMREKVGQVLKKFVTHDEIIGMLKEPCNMSLRMRVIEMVIGEIYSRMNVDQVQGICDSAVISQQGYRMLFRPFHDAIKSMGTKKIIIPRPYYMQKAKIRKNISINDILGSMYSLESGIPPKSGKSLKSKKADDKSDIMGLNANNNIWFDLEKVLKFMVVYYNLHESDIDGKLEICLKLDEMELVHKKKFERVSLTLMNKALSADYDKQRQTKKKKRDAEWFSVQSEEHTWWLGMFQVCKENHAVLKWVFDQTDIPRLISVYNNGEKLHVEGFGSFMVNFHLASDLKTEKAMFNMSSSGAKTTKNCTYCCHVLKEKNGPSKSTLSCDQDLPRDRDRKDVTFQPILPIPLERVHICTLHAFIRIVERMIFHSECFVWNIRNEQQRLEGIERVEKVLSEAGLHGGCVKLEKDTKRSNGRSSIPAKVSIGGDRARHFLNGVDGSQGVFGFGKRLVEAEKDRTDGLRAEAKKLHAWNALSDLNAVFQKPYFNDADKQTFRVAVKRFTQAYIKAWGECEVTHYIHIVYAHGPWFADKYGSLAIWNTQGMEKSHKQAKMAFNRKTQCGGCHKIGKANPLVQMGQWFYRKVLTRHEQNMARRASPKVHMAVAEAKKRKQDAWKNSDASSKLREWREKRRRIGSKYCV